MLVEAFADAAGFLVLDGRQVAGVRRRRRHGLVPQRVEHPRRPAHGKRSRAVGQIRQNAGHSQHAAAPVIGWGGHPAELVPLHAVDAVMLREAFVDDQEVAVEKAR